VPPKENPVTCSAVDPALCNVMIDCAAEIVTPRTPVTMTLSVLNATLTLDEPSLLLEDDDPPLLVLPASVLELAIPVRVPDDTLLLELFAELLPVSVDVAVFALPLPPPPP
jgi:hypothetical protein